MNFVDESACLTADEVQMKVSSYLCIQITGGVENAVPLNVDIPCTSRRDSDLPFEAVLREYLQFPYEYFLLALLPFGGLLL
jgi:hypothetical protein